MTIAIRQLTVPREHQQIFQGQTVLIVATIADVNVVSVLLEPDNVPVITLFNPSAVALITDQPMVQLSTGVYTYAFQTSALHPVGVYTVNITAVHGSEVARLEKIVVFKIIAVTSLATFTYFAIQDQTGVVWYWYIAADNTVAFSLTVPVIAGKQATAILPALVPHWLEISNPTPALRYVYPEITGEVTVTATQPATGSGQVGSPTFGGVSGSNFTLTLNISDEVVVNVVS